MDMSTSKTKAFDAGYHGLVRTEVIPLIPKTGGTLLDFGGGVGATAKRAKDLGLVERAGVIDIMAGRTDENGLDYALSGDLEDFEFVDKACLEHGPFSVVLCLDILEHLRDPWRAISIIHRYLEPNGYIVASIPNIRNYKAVLPLVFANQWQLADQGILDRTHLRFFVKDTAIELMTHTGLTLDAFDVAPSGGRRVKLFRLLTMGLLNSFTDRQFLIRVKAETAAAAKA